MDKGELEKLSIEHIRIYESFENNAKKTYYIRNKKNGKWTN